MVSTRKKRQSSRRLLSQLDYFDQDIIFGNAASERQGNVVVNTGSEILPLVLLVITQQLMKVRLM